VGSHASRRGDAHALVGNAACASVPSEALRTLHFSGVLDISRYPEFREAFQEAPRDDGVLVDLRETSGVDSIFLSELVLFRRRHQLGVAVVVQPGSNVAFLFDVARMREKLDVYDSVDAALTALGER
jgi:anti-anti-sigma regulatory factor